MDFPRFFFCSLILKIKYPHLAGVLYGPPSPLQELEVLCHSPLYLLVIPILQTAVTSKHCHYLCNNYP